MSEDEEVKSVINVTKLRKTAGRKPGKDSKRVVDKMFVSVHCEAENFKYIQDIKSRTGHSTNRIVNEALAYVAKKDGLSNLPDRLPAPVERAREIIAEYERKLKSASH